MVPDRQRRRQLKRHLLQHGEAALKHGLPSLPPKDSVLGLALLLRETLADTGVPDRASCAAEIVHKVFEASMKSSPSNIELACKKGCAYCCHGWVSATAPELFLLARTLKRAHATSRDQVLTRAARLEGLSIDERFGRKLSCALLADNMCQTYAARPTVCRQVTSTSLPACIDEYEGRDLGGEIVVSKVALDHARNCRLPLQAALKSIGLAIHSYELNAGLRAAMEPTSEQAWLSGSDRFADVVRAPDDPASLRQAIVTVAEEIAAL